MNTRIESLDSLRGLASLSVVIHHILLATPLFFLTHEHHKVDEWLVTLFSSSPLHMLWAGHEAVMLFFVLSGFVLALPFLNQRNTSYPKYITKRFCRIYIPYIISIVISIFLMNMINPTNVNGMSDNFNNQWSYDVGVLSMISYVLMLGYDTFNINGPIWSLVHEMRISLFFPLLMFFVLKYNWKKTLSVGIIICMSIWAILMLTSVLINLGSISTLLQSFADTFYYTSFFIIGATLAKYRNAVMSKVKNFSFKTKTITFILFILLYNIEWITIGFGDLKFANSFIVSKAVTIICDFAIAGSVVLLFSMVLSSKKFDAFLTKKPLVYLGKISYSLYLVHTIVLLSVVHLLNGYFSIPTTLFLVLISSILVAIIYYNLIEKPSIKLGKYMTSPSNKKNKEVFESA